MNGMVKGVCGLAVVGLTVGASGLSFMPTNLSDVSGEFVQETPVKGVVYGGIGIGTATIKKVGTFPVVIE